MTACSKTEQAAEAVHHVLWCRLCLPGSVAWQPVRLGQDFTALQAMKVMGIICCLCQHRDADAHLDASRSVPEYAATGCWEELIKGDIDGSSGVPGLMCS